MSWICRIVSVFKRNLFKLHVVRNIDFLKLFTLIEDEGFLRVGREFFRAVSEVYTPQISEAMEKTVRDLIASRQRNLPQERASAESISAFPADSTGCEAICISIKIHMIAKKPDFPESDAA